MAEDDLRNELTHLLEERAKRLSPTDEMLGRALRRCVRHEIRTQMRAPGRLPNGDNVSIRLRRASQGDAVDESEEGVLLSPGEGVAALPADGQVVATELEPEPAPDPGPAGLEEPIATAVAIAKTLTDDESSPARPPVPKPTIEADDNDVDPIPTAPTTGTGQPRRKVKRLEQGRVIGGYKIEGLLGIGGMGQVYLATQLSMNRQVALKVLSPKFSRNPRFRERFLREARAAGRLHHPHLIAVHDVAEAEGLMYFSMELVEGSSVRHLIKELGNLTEERAIDIVLQTLEALRYAHGTGTIHRDIKPDNLMLTKDGSVKVADLGLSRRDNGNDELDAEDFTTKTGTMMGTPYYMPPEQGRDAHRADHRADIYALGATLYHMVCGKVPFEGETAVAILINASTQPLVFPDPPPAPWLRAYIERLMAKKPSQRPQSAAEAIDLLKKLRSAPQAATIVGSRPGPGFSPAKVRRKRRWPAWLRLSLLVAGIGILLLLALWTLQRRSPLERLRKDVVELTTLDKFAAAIGLIDLEIGRSPHISAEAGVIRRGVESSWDTWAVQQSREILDGIDAAITDHRFNDADDLLEREIPEEWRSPRLITELKNRERALTEARSRAGTVDARPTVAQAFADAWFQRQLSGRVTITDGKAMLSEAGRVELSPPTRRGMPVPLPIRLSVRFLNARPGAELRLDLGPSRSLVINAKGVELVDGDRKQAISQVDEQGESSVVFLQRGDEIEVFLPDGGRNDRQRVEGKLVLVWSLPEGTTAEAQAKVFFKPLRR